MNRWFLAIVALAAAASLRAAETGQRVAIEDLVQLGYLSGIELSPDGKWAAFSATRASLASGDYEGVLQLVRVDGRDEAPLPVSYFRSTPLLTNTNESGVPPCPVGGTWSSDGRTFAYTRPANGGLEIRLHDLATHGDRMLVVAEPGARVIRCDPESVLYSTPAPASSTRAPMADPGIIYPPSATWDITGFFSAGDSHALPPIAAHGYHRVDLATGGITSANPPPDAEPVPGFPFPRRLPDRFETAISFSKWLPSHRGILLIYRTPDPEGEHAAVYRTDRIALWDGRDPKSLRVIYTAPDNATLESAAVSHDGLTVRVVERGLESSAALEVELASGSARELVRIPESLSECVFRGPDDLIAVKEAPTSPPQLVRIKLKTAEITPLFDPNVALRGRTFPHVEWRRVVSTLGDQMGGQLVFPYDYIPGRRYPLVVVQYKSGLRFLNGGVGNEVPILPLAAAGFMVLSFDTGPNIAPSRTRNLAHTLEHVSVPWDGIERIRNELIREGRVDARACGVSGLSHGAEITSYGLWHASWIGAAAMSSANSYDPSAYWSARDYARVSKVEMGMGIPDEAGLARWKQISLAMNVDRMTAPLLLQVADSEVPFTLELAETLRARGKPVEMIMYPGEGHVKARPASRYWAYRRYVDWFKFWLLQADDHSPSVDPQYQRWQALRDAARKTIEATP